MTKAHCANIHNLIIKLNLYFYHVQIEEDGTSFSGEDQREIDITEDEGIEVTEKLAEHDIFKLFPLHPLKNARKRTKMKFKNFTTHIQKLFVKNKRA